MGMCISPSGFSSYTQEKGTLQPFQWLHGFATVCILLYKYACLEVVGDGLGCLGEGLGGVEGGALHAVGHGELLTHVVQVVVAH